MRIAELLFLVFLLLYHLALLAPRYRRAFALNYLVFLSGIALALSLGLEGLRWQMLPPAALLLLDLLWLFPTFSTLRGQMPPSGWVSWVKRLLRSLVATLAFLVASASLALAVLMPLPQIPLSGGLPVALRHLSVAAEGGSGALDVVVWYPASGNLTPQPALQSSPAWWTQTAAEGGLPPYWQAYLEHLPSPLVRGGKLARPGTPLPTVVLALAGSPRVGEWSALATDLASRGFVVAAAQPATAAAVVEPFSWSGVASQLAAPFTEPVRWLNPELGHERAVAKAEVDWKVVGQVRTLLRQLANEPGDVFFGSLDLDRLGLAAWHGAPKGRAVAEAGDWAGTVWLGDQPAGARKGTTAELWVTPDPTVSPSVLDKSRWVLQTEGLHWADLADAAYLKPYLAFFGLKTRADGSLHAQLAAYLAAFFQMTLWGGDGSLFESGQSPAAGLRLLRQ